MMWVQLEKSYYLINIHLVIMIKNTRIEGPILINFLNIK